jgi:hypothetical protein
MLFLYVHFFSMTAQAGQTALSFDLLSPILDVVKSDDESSVAALTSSQLFFLSTKDWEIVSVAPCGTLSAQGVTYGDDDVLYIGCSDGSISLYNDGLQTNAFTIDSAEVLGLAYADQYIYAVAEQEEGGNPRVHAVDISTGVESSGGYPSTLGYGSFSDAEIVGSSLIIAHSGSNVSKVALSSGSAARDDEGPTTPKFTDVLRDATASNALIAGGSAGVIQFQLSTNNTVFSLSGDDFSSITALCVHEGDPSIMWLGDSGSSSVKSVLYTIGSSSPGSEIQTEVPVSDDGDFVEMVSIDGYLFYGTDGGSLGVVTDRPWVSATVAEPTSIGENEEFGFSFTATSGGDYGIYVGDTTTEAIQVGTMESGETIEIAMESTSDFVEGENEIWIVVENEEGKAGHDVVFVTVDTPPSSPNIDSIGFGNQSLTVNFTGIEDADISHYIVYMSKEEFLLEDYETGGPDFKELSEEERTYYATPSENISFSLQPLTNEQTYYIAVRAYDESGMESEWSNLLSGTPKPTFAASDLLEEEGGYEGCQHVSSQDLSLYILCLLFGIRYRRESKR